MVSVEKQKIMYLCRALQYCEPISVILFDILLDKIENEKSPIS